MRAGKAGIQLCVLCFVYVTDSLFRVFLCRQNMRRTCVLVFLAFYIWEFFGKHIIFLLWLMALVTSDDDVILYDMKWKERTSFLPKFVTYDIFVHIILTQSDTLIFASVRMYTVTPK